MRTLFRQFSTPGGVPSHCRPHTPNSMHEGGELGYSLVHAYGAAFDSPDLIVACVVGDGEAETGPLAGSWQGNKFLNPARDGAVLPILHLNGYKISGPTVEAQAPQGGAARSVPRPWSHRRIWWRAMTTKHAPVVRRLLSTAATTTSGPSRTRRGRTAFSAAPPGP